MRFAVDHLLLGGLLLLAAIVGGRAWLRDHPHLDPWVPLSLSDDPDGWVTKRKIAQMRADPAECRAFLERSDVAFTQLAPTGEGSCRREDRQVLARDVSRGLDLQPSGAQSTCAVGAGLIRWLHHGAQPAAQTILGSRIIALEHYGTHNCRRIGGGDTGTWSQHATGNAIDISGFVLADGRRIVVQRDWSGEGPEAAFLRAARDTSCNEFSTVLSPDYNAAHTDHLHLDQAQRGPGGWSFCR
ncbi:extensin family protein [Novosphingobium sp. RD2P27]|uniref:Extensin family protein n=1 Tax=Novosphingobium kalidii TaxID=3230299 RepID=A0ABV2CY81_9SPHN